MIRPGGLRESEAGLEQEGIVFSGPDQQDSDSIPRRLVARVCLDALQSAAAIGLIIEISSHRQQQQPAAARGPGGLAAELTQPADNLSAAAAAPMRRIPVVQGVSLLVVAVAGSLAVHWLASPVNQGHRSRPRASASEPGSTTPRSPASAGPNAAQAEAIDPSLPVYIGPTRRLVAQAIDDTAASAMNQALIGLARRFLGKPRSAFSLDQRPAERLLLDLDPVDQLRFVEQLVALVNSRQVATRTEAVDRFSDHVRQLRYEGGEVAYCRRHHDFSRWAQAAERRGYLVNLTPFLPGASSRRRRLTFLSSLPELHRPMRSAAHRSCITTLEKTLAVDQAYVPLAGLSAVLPSLRNGDLYALVTQRPGLDISDVGVVEVKDQQINAIHVAGSAVKRTPDLVHFAQRSAGVLGVSFHRPIPNPDGRADR
ncbi:MAG: N-acetylmuramoyl-L-alanine amidase-like domain-containing protein [Cyanobium sp.]